MTKEAFKPYMLKILILLSALYALITMLHWPVGFTFFTQLSSIYAAVVVVLQILYRRRKALILLKYTAAVSIAVTFFVFLLILAPMDPRGLVAAYAQDNCASLCMHFVTPVLTVLDFLKNDAKSVTLEKRHIALAVLPPLAYFLFILALGQFGFRWAGNMTAPYLFLNYAAPAGWFGFMPETADFSTMGIGVFYAVIVMMGIFLLFGRALAAASKLVSVQF